MDTSWDWVTFADLDRDPYPIYARLRAEAPVAWVPTTNKWLVTRWDDCAAAGKDEDAFTTSHDLDAFFGTPQILSMEGPEHKGLRAGVDPPFRSRALADGFEAFARPVVRRYVSELWERGAADATRDLYEPISARIIADMLGLSDVDDATLVRWFQTLNSGMNNDHGDPAVAAETRATVEQIDAYMADMIERLQRDGNDGSGFGCMVHIGTLDGRPRSFAELIGSIRVIILGGFQEPGHGAASSLLGLLQDPRQVAAVIEDPATYVPLAVHEGLRWIAPFGIGERVPRHDVTIRGVEIPAGAEVGLVMASANRDEERYEDGDRFDVFRPKLPHMSFGFGSHFCSGHAVSRALEEIILEETFAGLPGIELDPDHEPVVAGWFVRSVQHLPVRWSA